MEPASSQPVRSEKHRKLKMFAVGLGVRLVGVWLIWLGDHHDSLLRKGVVVVGVILSIGGITVLRYMLLAGPLSKLPRLFGRKSPPKDRGA